MKIKINYCFTIILLSTVLMSLSSMQVANSILQNNFHILIKMVFFAILIGFSMFMIIIACNSYENKINELERENELLKQDDKYRIWYGKIKNGVNIDKL